MKLTIYTSLEGRHCEFQAAVDIQDVMYEAFAPLKRTDDVSLAMAAGDMLLGSRQAERVIKIRKDAAKEISAVLTNMLLDAMRQNDEINGYRVVDEIKYKEGYND